MEYKRLKDKITLRIDRGEEAMSSLLDLAVKEKVCGSISAIGACDEFEVGLYRVEERKYISKKYKGDFEIVSCLGNLTVKDGKPYLHLHIACADENNNTFGGHLSYCKISGTFECVIEIIDGEVNRKVDDKTSLNIFDFKQN